MVGAPIHSSDPTPLRASSLKGAIMMQIGAYGRQSDWKVTLASNDIPSGVETARNGLVSTYGTDLVGQDHDGRFEDSICRPGETK